MAAAAALAIGEGVVELTCLASKTKECRQRSARGVCWGERGGQCPRSVFDKKGVTGPERADLAELSDETIDGDRGGSGLE